MLFIMIFILPTGALLPTTHFDIVKIFALVTGGY
jgi:hypothetical protein